MAAHEPTDEQLLKKIRLSDADLRDLQKKHSHFVASLNEAQKKSLAKSLPTTQEAAQTLGPGVTPERLEKFLRARAPKSESILLANRNDWDDEK